MARTKVILKGDPIINEECTAAAAITPGHLIMRASANTVQKNTANAADVARAFAMERDELGNAMATAYGVGDVVKEAVCYPGCRVYAIVPSGQNIAAGDYLEADNAGRLVAYSAGAKLARALEAVVSTADTRIRAEII